MFYNKIFFRIKHASATDDKYNVPVLSMEIQQDLEQYKASLHHGIQETIPGPGPSFHFQDQTTYFQDESQVCFLII